MKKLITLIFCYVFTSTVQASSGGDLDHVSIDMDDKASLQNGAKLYVNYCMGCHALGFMRYNRMAKDIGLSEESVLKNLLFSDSKIGDLMTIALPKQDAEKWFGTPPPDLSVVSRSRGTDWLYTYLRSFYQDNSRPFGVNNRVFKDVGMPHVLMQLQGQQKAIKEDVEGIMQVVGVELVSAGQLSANDYDAAIRDVVNFLAYVGEPAQLVRKALGIKVILFLIVFFFLALALKKEYWRDVH